MALSYCWHSHQQQTRPHTISNPLAAISIRICSPGKHLGIPLYTFSLLPELLPAAFFPYDSCNVPYIFISRRHSAPQDCITYVSISLPSIFTSTPHAASLLRSRTLQQSIPWFSLCYTTVTAVESYCKHLTFSCIVPIPLSSHFVLLTLTRCWRFMRSSTTCASCWCYNHRTYLPPSSSVSSAWPSKLTPSSVRLTSFLAVFLFW